MSKTMRSLVCVIMSVVLLLSMNVWSFAVSAEETTVQPRLSYTNYTFTGLDITTKGIAYCTAHVEGYSGITTKVHIEMKLQKYTVLWWSTQETWEGTFNSVDGALSKTKTVSDSGKYRVRVTYTVYSGSASEEITGTSQTVTYSG